MNNAPLLLTEAEEQRICALMEEEQCTRKFAQMIVEAERGPWEEIGDDFLTYLDKLIEAAEAKDGGKATH